MTIYMYSTVRIVGIQVEFHHSIWNLGGIYVDSMWIPDGHSIWNDGIHMESILFHVDSRWDGMTKMAGIPPKTYSIWNRWNPSGMTWIPLGFHIDSMWNT